MFHEDLKNTQRRMLRAKTKSALLFQKINLNPMALPINLRPRFAAIVNATKDAHRHGDLFRPERVGASFRGFQQRMLSRFYAGEMLLEHKSLLGYKYILRFDAIQVRITSAFSYDPFERAQVLKSVYNFHSTVVDSPVTVINPLLKKWLDTYEFAGKLMKPFVNRDAGEIHHNGRAYSQSAELFNLDAFKTTTYRTLFESADADCEFLLGDTHETSLTSGQFLGIAMPFVAAKTPGAVTYLDDLPIQHPIDLDDLYT